MFLPSTITLSKQLRTKMFEECVITLGKKTGLWYEIHVRGAGVVLVLHAGFVVRLPDG